jgi:A/G-specific adenine glycosylase
MRPIETEKITFFQKHLLSWYKKNRRNYYWRTPRLTTYQYIIAEVLLQRTKADTIANFYPDFISEFPNWQSLANARLDTIETFLKPVGLYKQKAMRLQNLAKEMVKRNGRLPKNRADLESIPFMGQYIANAVELVIFNQPSPLVDVNMARVIERFFGPRKMADIRYDPYLQELAYKIVDHPKAKYINWAVLDFAALICQARIPQCKICILKKNCVYFSKNSSFILSSKLGR